MKIYQGKIKFVLFLIAFVAIYLSFRLPWITSDPGIPSIWEYGYNATDEGYYLAGGKEKFLWGCFVDLPRNEAFTYGFSAGTHYLSYLAHLFFGLSSWTWRIPFLFVFLLGWISMFCHLAKRASVLTAFVLCTSVSMMPMVIAYERTASNDALIGALLVLSYVVASGKAVWRIIGAALISSLIILVKPSVWVLLPIVASGVIKDADWRKIFKDLILFFVVAVSAAFLWKLVVALVAIPDAARANVSIWEIVKKTTTHYPLPRIFDFISHFKGISAFPRDPSIQLLGVTAPLILTVPLMVAAKMVLLKRWNGKLLMFIAVPVYVAAISVMNTIYTHYFIPVIVMLPIIIFEVSNQLEKLHLQEKGMSVKKAILPIFMTLSLCAICAISILAYSISPNECQSFYSRIYNFPSKNVWGMTWMWVIAYMGVVNFLLLAFNGFKIKALQMVVMVLLSFVAASVIFAPLPALKIAHLMKKTQDEYFAPLVVVMVVSSLFLLFVFSSRKLPWKKLVVLFIPMGFLSCYFCTPNWRTSFCELLRPGTKCHEQAAKELSLLLPKDAIVIGERSNQMLMSLPIRTATTFAANSNPIPVIENILKHNSEAKLYALIDSQHTYCLKHYREHANKYKLQHIKTLKMPSFGTGAMADVYLASIEVLKSKTP